MSLQTSSLLQATSKAELPRTALMTLWQIIHEVLPSYLDNLVTKSCYLGSLQNMMQDTCVAKKTPIHCQPSKILPSPLYPPYLTLNLLLILTLSRTRLQATPAYAATHQLNIPPCTIPYTKIPNGLSAFGSGPSSGQLNTPQRTRYTHSAKYVTKATAWVICTSCFSCHVMRILSESGWVSWSWRRRRRCVSKRER